jgi:hypothetical protein
MAVGRNSNGHCAVWFCNIIVILAHARIQENQPHGFRYRIKSGTGSSPE